MDNLFVLFAQYSYKFWNKMNWSNHYFCSLDSVTNASIELVGELRISSTMALTVWKSRNALNSLGQCLFPERSMTRETRSVNSINACQPVPGYPNLAANLMARVWNSVPGLSTATTLLEAKRKTQLWAKTLPKWHKL